MRQSRKNKALLCMFVVVLAECGLMLWAGYGDGGSGPRRLSSAAGDDGMLGGCDGSKGLLVFFYVISLCYLFLGLAIVCDDFFVASLEKLSEVFNLSDDVAGATFMAAGSSAPELATSIVDTFYFQSNVGFGTIVGSAVFNILVIIAASAALSKEDLLIDWRPFTRDVFFYLVCIILLVIFSQPETVIIDDVERQRGVILWWEALILIVWYLLYVAFMANNEKFMGMMGGGKNAVQPVTTARTRSNNANGSSAVFEVSSSKPKTDKVQAFDNDINNDDAEIKPERISPTTVPVSTAVTMPGAAPGAPILEPGYEAVKAPAEDTQVISAAEPVSSHPSPTGPMMNAFSDEESGGDEKKSCLDKVIACFSAPWTAIFTVTIPDCAKEKWEKYYVATFTISCFWIGVISWLLVFCATNFGCIVGINPIVMGVTILAGGTSIPDAISSVVVAKEGKGGMAVANAIGSNVFDVCLCLGIPYFIATVGNIDEIQIKTCNLTANIFTLLGTVVVVAVVLGISRWKLTKQVGGVLLAFYIVFCVWNLVGNKACD